MTPYRIEIARSAAKEYRALPAQVAKRVKAAIDSLAANPRPAGKSVKITASIDRWRVRVGDYRAVYEIDDAEHLVVIVLVRHRKDVYRAV
jgi:mRNA interferase RelE/StbE